MPDAKLYIGVHLSKYQLAINAAAASLARENPSLLTRRGKPLMPIF